MSTISAMSEEEIKRLVFLLNQPGSYSDWKRYSTVFRRLILTWATAKAEAERLEHKLANPFNRTDTDWLVAVLARIGWPKEA